ncbi:MAG: dihydroorotase [Pseudomonadota bacterium]
MNISILHGRVIDPASGLDACSDMHIVAGQVVAIGAAPDDFQADLCLDAQHQVVCPGLVDLATSLREPGFTKKGTLDSETAAAAKGGITTLVCTPDTNPVIDTPAVIELIQRKARQAGQARVLISAALTRGLDGRQLADMVALQRAGAVAFSQAGRPFADASVQHHALAYAGTFDLPVLLSPQDPALQADGCAHAGATATQLGLPGIPTVAETVALARDLALAADTGTRIHCRGLSAADSLPLLQMARQRRQAVSTDVAIHQLHLTDWDLADFDARCHVSPPLRTLRDRDALRQAVADGLIPVISSDHQPHDQDAKTAPFPATAPGISGLETLLALTLRLVQEQVLSLPEALARITCNPADALGLPYGRLAIGQAADVCIFDPDVHWTLRADQMCSRGHNTPFDGWDFIGQVTHTICEGRLVYQRDQETGT